jgi:hypothetical protein
MLGITKEAYCQGIVAAVMGTFGISPIHFRLLASWHLLTNLKNLCSKLVLLPKQFADCIGYVSLSDFVQLLVGFSLIS